MLFLRFLLILCILLPHSLITQQKNTKNTLQDTTNVYKGIFDIPEKYIKPSPDNDCNISFSNSEKVIDFDISPIGITVAAIIENKTRSCIKFWDIGRTDISDSCKIPDDLIPKSIVWHPNANAFFIMGVKGKNYQIYRFERTNNNWIKTLIYSTPNQLRRLVVCPRPFITGYNWGKSYYSYRLFFGMDNGDKSYRIVSITEHGNRFYQVVGPANTLTNVNEFDDAYDEPSKMEASWALPIAFHPAGNQMLWEDNNNNYFVASYGASYWQSFQPTNFGLKKGGTITPTPNGLGLIHWQKDNYGIGIYLISEKKEDTQRTEYLFISTPSSTHDGKGIVGLSKQNEQYTLNYVTIEVPLANIMNAWMFINSNEEVGLFQKYFGLFRPNIDDQLYKVYEAESYNRYSPSRPNLVTTDIFWELFGAAYRGLFILKERDEAIPNFWNFISKANAYLTNSKKDTIWKPVFAALTDFYSDNTKNPEVVRINNEQNCFTEIINDSYAYSDLKPRGYYISSPETKKYFKAFRYFTTIFKNKPDILSKLNTLPSNITTYAENWIKSYAGFIAPSRAPLVWKNLKNVIPKYCRYSQDSMKIFPLSWGFDNEVLWSTVYHENVPDEVKIQGEKGIVRLLPSGVDIASALGNAFADNLLKSDYDKYPPLRKVINDLRITYNAYVDKTDFKDNIYNRWINAIAVQWADTIGSINGSSDSALWQAKRLQSGLATWATLRHATILVNERSVAEAGEGGFEEILMSPPRGYVEPDPHTFGAIADLFENAVQYISKSTIDKSDIEESSSPEKQSLYDGINRRLKEAAQEARKFKAMAEKERRGEMLSDEENEKVLYVARIAEHLFLVFNSLENKDYALSNPDSIAKVADVAGDGFVSPFLLAAVGNAMEWDYIVPYYGRYEIVKGPIYSYYEFISDKVMNDEEWRGKVTNQDLPHWIKPYVTNRTYIGMAKSGY